MISFNLQKCLDNIRIGDIAEFDGGNNIVHRFGVIGRFKLSVCSKEKLYPTVSMDRIIDRPTIFFSHILLEKIADAYCIPIGYQYVGVYMLPKKIYRKSAGYGLEGNELTRYQVPIVGSDK